MDDGILKNAFTLIGGVFTVWAAVNKWRESWRSKAKRAEGSVQQPAAPRRVPLFAISFVLWATLTPYWWSHMTNAELSAETFAAADPALLAIARNVIAALLEIFSVAVMVWFVGPSVRRDLNKYVGDQKDAEATEAPLNVGAKSNQQQLSAEVDVKPPSPK